MAWKDGLNTIGKPSHPDCEIVKEEEVSITTLDNFIKDNGITKVDLIKIDIEGAELLALQGARKLLENKNAPLIIYESQYATTKGFGYHPIKIINYLKRLGYFLFELKEKDGKVVPFASNGEVYTIIIATKSKSFLKRH